MSPATQTYSYEQALSMLPSVVRLTRDAIGGIEALFNCIQSREEAERRKDELVQAREEIVDRWRQDISHLGCEAKGLWLVDWDSGDGYYCWRYPEETLSFFHSYEEGFAGRLPIN